MPGLLKKIWRPILAIALIGFLIAKGPFDLNQLKFVLTQPKVIWLGLAIFGFQNIIFTGRWKLFVDLIQKVPFFRLFKLHFVGLFFNFFIPGGVGGDIVKALELSKSTGASRAQSLSTVMSDRVFGLFAMLLFSTTFLFVELLSIEHDYIKKLFFVSGLFLIGITAVLLFLPALFTKFSNLLNQKENKILKALDKLLNSLSFTFLTFRKPKIQIMSLAYSATSQLLGIFFMYQVVIALGIVPPSFMIFFSLCCFGFVAAAIPIMPGGIGVGQYAFYALFANISPELGQATITAITTLQIFTLFYSLLGGVQFAFSPNARRDFKEYERES